MNTSPSIPDELWQQIPPTAQAAIRALIKRYEWSYLTECIAAVAEGCAFPSLLNAHNVASA
jgi:hypothetical protein